MSRAEVRVLIISPGYPAEMPLFTRGLAAVGARVLGVGDQPARALPKPARDALSAYLEVSSLWDEAAVVTALRQWLGTRSIDLVECLWEPGMLLAARIREALGVDGMTARETIPFRDKERMKQALDAAGIRTPAHARAGTVAECREAAERIGFPLILKPVAGAGSADTHRVEGPREMEAIFPLLRHVAEVSVEEFIEGEEYTFDTVCARGAVLYENVSWYRPKPLIGRTVEWISPQTVCLRDLDAPDLREGRRMGPAVLRALSFRSGFTHMEWFLTPAGEAVFGEIAARPPGARSVDVMNYTSDTDLFTGWAEAVCHGTFSLATERRYNSAVVFKRAQGSGRIERVEGLDKLLRLFGERVVSVDLLEVGAQRRDWKRTLLSDGSVVVRDPDLATTLEMADRIGTDLKLFAR